MKKKVSSYVTSRYILIALTAICLIFISTSFFTDKLVAPLRDAVSMVVVPLQKGMNNLGLWTYDKYTTLQEISVVLDENKELKSKVDDLTEENNQLRQDTYELSRLRELYELDEKYPGYTKVGARIIEVTTDNWSKAFKVDKGSDDGIKKDMNVIAGNGLVGIVIDVGPHYAKVRSVIDDSAKVYGMILNTSDNCIINGNLQSMNEDQVIEFSGLNDSENKVQIGDQIVTSNVSDKYLQGILVGYVSSISEDSNHLTKSGTITPAVDFEHLQQVLVILDKKETGSD